MTTYYTSTGIKVTKVFIDGQIRKKKKEFIEDLREDKKLYCIDCGTTSERLSISHVISVNECQRTKRSELAWSKMNFRLLCIPCHQKFDGLDVKLNWGK